MSESKLILSSDLTQKVRGADKVLNFPKRQTLHNAVSIKIKRINYL